MFIKLLYPAGGNYDHIVIIVSDLNQTNIFFLLNTYADISSFYWIKKQPKMLL